MGEQDSSTRTRSLTRTAQVAQWRTGIVKHCSIDTVSLTRYPVPTLMWILANLQKTSPSMELREYDYASDTVGELISGPPAR